MEDFTLNVIMYELLDPQEQTYRELNLQKPIKSPPNFDLYGSINSLYQNLTGYKNFPFLKIFKYLFEIF